MDNNERDTGVMTLSVLFIKFTVALAAAVLLFACGTPGEPTRSKRVSKKGLIRMGG